MVSITSHETKLSPQSWLQAASALAEVFSTYTRQERAGRGLYRMARRRFVRYS